MDRRVISARSLALRPAGPSGPTSRDVLPPEIDGFFGRLFKYIPAEVNAGWVAVSAILAGLANPSPAVQWAVFVVFIPLTALITFRLTQKPGLPPAWVQIIIAVLAFVVWVLALGGPFATIPGYNRAWGGILLIIFTVAAPALFPSAELPRPQPTW